MVDMFPAPDEAQFIDALARVAGERFPVARLLSRPGVAAARDADQWHLIGELGWLALALPEGAGEIVYSLPQQVLAAREFGRALLTPVLLASMLGAEVAARAGDRARCEAIVAGHVRVAPAIAVAPLCARPQAGASFYLPDHAGCELALVWGDAGAGLFAIEACADLQAVDGVEECLPLARARLDTALPYLWVESTDLMSRASLLIAAQLIGVAEGARDMAIAYAKQREAFGQAIGAFQAIKHKCADMAVRAEVAWAEALFAALSEDQPSFAIHASSAKLLAADAAAKNAVANVQVHGAMGFTAECTAHLYLKRAQTLDWMAGANQHHQTRVLADLSIM